MADARMAPVWKKTSVQTLRILFSLCNVRGSISIVSRTGVNCCCTFASNFDNYWKRCVCGSYTLCNPGGSINFKVARPDLDENASASHFGFWRKMRNYYCNARFGSGSGLTSAPNEFLLCGAGPFVKRTSAQVALAWVPPRSACRR